MGQRNTQYPHQQMRDLQLEQGLSASRNNAEPVFLYVYYPERGTFYGNQYSILNFYAAPNFGPSTSVPPNFYNPYMFPSSSNWNFPAPQYNVPSNHLSSAGNMSEFGRDNQSVDSIIGFGKRKNAQMPPGNQHIVNCFGHSGSLPSVSFEPGVNLANSTNFEHFEYRDSGNVQTTEGSHRSVRSRSSVVSHQPEPAYLHHPQANYVLQAIHMGHSLHTATNLWMPHFGVENIIGGEACSNWNYNNPVTYMHGRCLQSGAFVPTNIGVPSFPDTSSSANATVIFNPALLPNFHPHLPPVQTILLQGYGHPVHMQVPYSHPLNIVLLIDVNSSSRVLNSDSRFLHVPPNAEHIYRPRQLHHAAPNFGRGGLRILSPEDAAVMDSLYGVGNDIDQHQNMRMDTSRMSYEELLALGEQIGFVRTGLTEEYVAEHLRTSIYSSQTRSRFSEETETCIICQVEYNEDEIIGTLDCGHYYHEECIKQWLVEKNLCPICKKTAFEAADVKEG